MQDALNLYHVERSLEEVKDVVRRKLDLGQATDVSLKQMGSDALLDLEDGRCKKVYQIRLRHAQSSCFRPQTTIFRHFVSF